MTELRIELHLNTWHIKPIYLKDRRRIEFSILFFTIKILTKKKRK